MARKKKDEDVKEEVVEEDTTEEETTDEAEGVADEPEEKPKRKRTTKKKPKPDLSKQYDASYYGEAYKEATGHAYGHTPVWERFFGTVAQRLISDFSPTKVLDAGCAMGVLVAAFNRNTRVTATGVDFSEYAISAAPDDVRGSLEGGNKTSSRNCSP